MFYTILTIGLYLLFYTIPIGSFLFSKLKRLRTIILFVGCFAVQYFFGFDVTEIFLLFTSFLILHSMTRKSLPHQLDSSIYDFKFFTFIHILPYVLAGKLVAGYLGGLASALFTYLGIEHQEVQQRVSELSSTDSLFVTILGFLSICIVAPVTEEYTIRHFLNGFLFKQKCRLNSLWSSVFSSFIFALLHDSIPGIVNAFFAGLLFAWVYNRFGLWYSIGAHAVFNLTAFIAIQMS